MDCVLSLTTCFLISFFILFFNRFLGANGNRSKVDGSHVKHSVHPSADSKTDESLRRSSSGGGTSWPASVHVGQRSKEEEEEEEEDVKEMKGNSLVNKGHKSGFDHGARVAAKPNADETLTSGTTGPFFPDQDQVRIKKKKL